MSATFKLLLVGAEHTGKHTLLYQFTDCQSSATPAPNGIPATIHALTLNTSVGSVTFNIWCPNHGMSQVDDEGNPVHRLPEEFYIGADCAIIMFDVTSRVTYREVPNLFRDIVRVCDNIPITLVGNKNDAVDRQVKIKMITFHRKKNLQYYDVSAKAQYRILDPFVWLTKRLSNNPTIQLLSTSPMISAAIDAESMKEHFMAIESQQEICQSGFLPCEDDDDDL
jgi:GTP-binding nuclear protein Ran